MSEELKTDADGRHYNHADRERSRCLTPATKATRISRSLRPSASKTATAHRVSAASAARARQRKDNDGLETTERAVRD